MSGFGAPAFTARPTLEIISKGLALPSTSPLLASSSTTSVLVTIRSTTPCLTSALIAGWALKLIFTLCPLAFSNIGTSVPMTSGSGPPLAATVISAAFAAAAAIMQAAVNVTIFDQTFIASSLGFAGVSSLCSIQRGRSIGLQSLGVEHTACSRCREEGDQRPARLRRLGVDRDAGRELRGVLQLRRERTRDIDTVRGHQLGNLLHANLGLAVGDERAGKPAEPAARVLELGPYRIGD